MSNSCGVVLGCMDVSICPGHIYIMSPAWWILTWATSFAFKSATCWVKPSTSALYTSCASLSWDCKESSSTLWFCCVASRWLLAASSSSLYACCALTRASSSHWILLSLAAAAASACSTCNKANVGSWLAWQHLCPIQVTCDNLGHRSSQDNTSLHCVRSSEHAVIASCACLEWSSCMHESMRQDMSTDMMHWSLPWELALDPNCNILTTHGSTNPNITGIRIGLRNKALV